MCPQRMCPQRIVPKRECAFCPWYEDGTRSGLTCRSSSGLRPELPQADSAARAAAGQRFSTTTSLHLSYRMLTLIRMAQVRYVQQQPQVPYMQQQPQVQYQYVQQQPQMQYQYVQAMPEEEQLMAPEQPQSQPPPPQSQLQPQPQAQYQNPVQYYQPVLYAFSSDATNFPTPCGS